MYEVKYAEDVSKDLKELTAFKRKEILDRIDQELVNEPTRETRNKKVLSDVEPPWPFKEPLRELRVGDYRVFYDVDLDASRVVVRAIRHKPPHKTTKEIL
jgi:mRNA-degrading endonuclease RelE of RelBE toxin-antitoxin system